MQQLVESTPTLVDLCAADAALLRCLGQQLASLRGWWGAGAELGEASTPRSVVRVEIVGDGRYLVTVLNMVGVVKLQTVQLQVVPKIPLDHFLHLIERCELAPRNASSAIHVDPSTALVEVLARWCVSEVERLLSSGLRPGYKSFSGEQNAVRGNVLPCETLLEVLKGRPVAICAYEELSDDAPLNRIIRAACQRLAGLSLLTAATRARARAVTYRMDGIGPIRPQDLHVEVDRVSQRYARAVPLARLVLNGLGVSLAAGPNIGSAFLLRTPELIESGLRAVVTAALGEVPVTAGRLMLSGTGLSMNPDLVFGRGNAVGDVKYKYFDTLWGRGDLYQSIAFATAYRCLHSLVIGFLASADTELPPSVIAGAVSTTPIAWVADPTKTPGQSERELRARLVQWYADVEQRSAVSLSTQG